jgi:DNA repair photolyase
MPDVTFCARQRPPNNAPEETFVESRSILTRATGFIRAYKFTLNPYRGCGFACSYCYAAFFAPTSEHQAEWGRWVNVKRNAAELVQRAIRARKAEHRLEPGDAVYMSSVTDPYQPIEKKLGLTRRVLEALLPVQPRLTVQTRSPIVVRDIDLLQRFDQVRVNLSITTDSEANRRRYEPHCPSIRARLRTAHQLADAGIPIGVCVSPMLPIDDPAAFTETLAELKAHEYVAGRFTTPKRRFAAGTGADALRLAVEDDWTVARYERDRDIIATGLARYDLTLLEGARGFQPAG